MSKDYKPAVAREKPASKGSPFMTGLLIGLLLGVGISLAVVLMVKGSTSPFSDNGTQGAAIDASTKSNKAPEPTETEAVPKENPAALAEEDEKARFDFYTILPGSESQVSEEEIKLKEAEEASQTVTENYFLQVGAFQNEEDADNQKAKLALLGLEAIVQTAEIPEKGIWHRVRVGPFANLDQINKARGDLVANGFSADLIRVKSQMEKP